MTVQAILLPLFVEVILTFLLFFWMAALRTRDFSNGAVRPENVALREPNWPARTTQVANAFSNQCELPVLFYVLTILAYVTHLESLVPVRKGESPCSPRSKHSFPICSRRSCF